MDQIGYETSFNLFLSVLDLKPDQCVHMYDSKSLSIIFLFVTFLSGLISCRRFQWKTYVHMFTTLKETAVARPRVCGQLLVGDRTWSHAKRGRHFSTVVPKQTVQQHQTERWKWPPAAVHPNDKRTSSEGHQLTGGLLFHLQNIWLLVSVWDE